MMMELLMYDPSIAKKVIEHWDEVLRSREDEITKNLVLRKQVRKDGQTIVRYQSR